MTPRGLSRTGRSVDDVSRVGRAQIGRPWRPGKKAASLRYDGKPAHARTPTIDPDGHDPWSAAQELHPSSNGAPPALARLDVD